MNVNKGKSMCVIVNLACGLANRMFQYSYYLYLKQQGFHVLTDAYDSGKLAHEQVAWERIFPDAALSPASKRYVMLIGGGNDVLSRFRRRYFPFTTCVQQLPTAFDVALPKKGNSYVIGCFQSAEMVEGVAHEVRKAFRFTPFEDDYNKGLAEEMQSCESVAIHVRKGKDYQQRIWYRHTCPVEYYLKAVAYMKAHLSNPHFYVFADNKKWVKENMAGFDYTLVDGNPNTGYGNHFDMQLMSLCRHNIISNSTYSWWSAYLNGNPSKTVLVPDVWFNPSSCGEFRSIRLLCNKWIAI